MSGTGVCCAKEVGDAFAPRGDCSSFENYAHATLPCQGQQSVPAVFSPGVPIALYVTLHIRPDCSWKVQGCHM